MWHIKKRPAKRVRIISINPCQIEASFLKSYHKVKNDSSSISKKCTSTDRQRPDINPNFFGLCSNLRQVCLFSEQTGVFLSETDSERFLDSDESVCDKGLWSLFDFFATFLKCTRSLVYGGKKHPLSLLHLFEKSSSDKCPRDRPRDQSWY